VPENALTQVSSKSFLYGDTPKLRGSLVRSFLLNYGSNIIVANANHIRYSNKEKNKDNPQPSLVLFNKPGRLND